MVQPQAESYLNETLLDPAGKEKFYFNFHYKRYLETLKTVIRYVPLGSHILEVGSLFGHVSISLKKMSYNVVVSETASNIQRFSSRFELFGIRMHPCDLNGGDLPFQDGVFDCVVITEVIEHLQPMFVKSAIFEVARVLKDKGIIVLSTPNVTNLGNRLLLLLGKPIPTSEDHVREYSLAEVNSFFKDSHIEIVQEWFSTCQDHKHSDSALWKKLAKPLLLPLRLIHPVFRTTIFVVGEKQA